MVIVAIMNLTSMLNKKMLYWIATVMLLVILDINVCYADWIFESEEAEWQWS
eukprot:gene15717-14514_t